MLEENANRTPNGTQQLKPGYERVYTVTDYYDGPRAGIADYQNKPHFYQCVFDERRGNYSDEFRLSPVDRETFNLAMEDWSIWKRWELAYHSGEVDIGTHPALPHEAARHAELKETVERALLIDPVRCVTRIGRFEAIGGAALPKGVTRDLQVKWEEVPNQT